MRVADLNGARGPVASTLSEGNSSRANKTNETDVLTLEERVDQAEHDSKLQQSLNSEYDGVLYCDLDKGNGLPIKSSVTEGNTIMIEEPSVPCIQNMDEQ